MATENFKYSGFVGNSNVTQGPPVITGLDVLDDLARQANKAKVLRQVAADALRLLTNPGEQQQQKADAVPDRLNDATAPGPLSLFDRMSLEIKETARHYEATDRRPVRRGTSYLLTNR